MGVDGAIAPAQGSLALLRRQDPVEAILSIKYNPRGQSAVD
ncbi:MAG TPA: hypothetical protein V6D27_17970 [Vampirovibrionales bacterium]